MYTVSSDEGKTAGSGTSLHWSQLDFSHKWSVMQSFRVFFVVSREKVAEQTRDLLATGDATMLLTLFQLIEADAYMRP